MAVRRPRFRRRRGLTVAHNAADSFWRFVQTCAETVWQDSGFERNLRSELGCIPIFWSGSCGAAIPPIDDFGPAVVFEAAFDGEQGVGARFRLAASRLFEPVPDDAFADAFMTPDPTCNQRAR